MISDYHTSKQQRSEERSVLLLAQKEQELLSVGELGRFKQHKRTKIAVLGVADKRHIRGHDEMFRKLLGHPVDIYSFDITTQHLEGEKRVFEQDVTEAIPYGPYDIVYSHVLFKFIQKDKRFKMIDNSIGALKEGGIAIHVVNIGDRYKENDISGKELEKYLTQQGITVHSIKLEKGDVVVMEKGK